MQTYIDVDIKKKVQLVPVGINYRETNINTRKLLLLVDFLRHGDEITVS